ncbi:hypothetical protein MBLNU457_5116t1 [Dothideomycetes sp. NU457]
MATIPLGQYLWTRIRDVGINTVMGLPGDFQLNLLDYINDIPNLRFVGNGNELNAAYAADGYSRVKHVPGCIVTTHGVGELSALNGIAGSMTEQVKIIHVVGQTKRSMQRNHEMIHHSIGFRPDHQVFNKASQSFRVAAAELQDVHSAPHEIDRVIRACFVQSGPVYIFIPLDMVSERVPAELLKTPINLSPPRDVGTEQTMDAAATAIVDTISRARNPVVLVDGLIHRHNAIDELRQLVGKLRFPIYCTSIGKGIISETNPLNVGVYNGAASGPGIASTFETNDLVLLFGHLPADTNTAGFTQKIVPGKTINFKPDEVDVPGRKPFSRIYYKDFLPYLTHRISVNRMPKVEIPSCPRYTLDAEPQSQKITAAWFWPYFSDFLRPRDVVFGETGTSMFGIQDCLFPEDVSYQSQTYYGSIGWATPAAFGTEMALQDIALSNTSNSPRRTVLVTGDGSLQLTIQEIGSMIHHKTKPIIIIINNAGYTIERAIHGAKESYNDIVPYNFSFALRLFGMSEAAAKAHFFRVSTRQEVEEVLANDDLRQPDMPFIIEVLMDAVDAPWRMLQAIALRGPETVKDMVDGGFKWIAPTTN